MWFCMTCDNEVASFAAKCEHCNAKADGDTVSVKPGQAVLGAVASLGSLRLNPPAMINPVLCHHHSPQVNRDLSYACTSVVDHSGDHYHEYSGRHWNQHGWTDLPLAPESTLQSSRRELAESLLKTMVEWDMRSCTVKQQREFLDAIRMLKKEARQ